ncbi:hypothetical protein [Desulfocurvus sp. DL9XJH121]
MALSVPPNFQPPSAAGAADIAVPGDAPASDMENPFQAHSQALGNAAHTPAQQQGEVPGALAQALIQAEENEGGGNASGAEPGTGGGGVMNTASTTNAGLLDALTTAWDKDES